MSRIQQVLDKAELEGSIRRTRTVGALIDRTERASASSPAVDKEPGAAHAPSVVTGTILDSRLMAGRSANGPAAEQYRALRTRLAHVDRQRPEQVLLVTSPGRGEGRSLTVANLGLTMAQESQRRICVVDADLRRPSQHALFGVGDTPGVCDVILNRATLDEALVHFAEYDVTLLPAGTAPAHPAELLGTAAMHRVLKALRARFDAVVVDAPAATPLADIGILTPLVDGVIVVVRAGVTTRPAIHDTIAAIDSKKLLGVVLNGALRGDRHAGVQSTGFGAGRHRFCVRGDARLGIDQPGQPAARQGRL
jgi:capsular exopolysaccharide synthesis family protein